MPLHASLAGLLGRFAPLGFALAFSFLSSLELGACILLAVLSVYKNFQKKKSESQSTGNAPKSIEMQKNCYPFDP